MGILIGWLVLAAIVGMFASERGRSGFGYFLLSAILSPLVGLIVLLVLPNPSEKEAEEQRRREEHEQQLESIRAINRGGAAPTPGSSLADELTKLATLRDKGVLTQTEFEAQKAALLGTSTA